MKLTEQRTDCGKYETYLKFYKDELFKILQPFRIFGSRWSHCEIQGKDSFQAVHPEKKFKLCDSTGYTYDMNAYLGKEDKERHNTW